MAHFPIEGSLLQEMVQAMKQQLCVQQRINSEISQQLVVEDDERNVFDKDVHKFKDKNQFRELPFLKPATKGKIQEICRKFKIQSPWCYPVWKKGFF